MDKKTWQFIKKLRHADDCGCSVCKRITMNLKEIHTCIHCGNAWANLMHKGYNCDERCANCNGELCPRCDGWRYEPCDDCNVLHDMPKIILEAQRDLEEAEETKNSAYEQPPYRIHFND